MSRRRLFALLTLPLLALVAIVAIACGGDDDGDLEQITFMAGFTPQASLPFVGVYVADARGFFADEGLAVRIEHTAGQGQHRNLLLAKKIEFTTASAQGVLERRADGLPLTAIALFGQRGDQGYVVRADSGIESPADFRGRSVGFKAGKVAAEFHAMLAGVGLTVDDVNLQAVGFSPVIFIEGQVDVYPVFLNNEPDTIRRAGVEITVFDPADYGVPTLGVTYIAHTDTVMERPELVERFLRASLRGVRYASEHIDEAIEITLRFAEGADPEHQRFLLEQDLKGAARSDGIGRGTREQWAALEQLLRRYGVIETEVDVSQAFIGSFVDSLYDADGRLR